MKNIFSLILISFTGFISYGQIFFGEQQLISTAGISRPETIFSTDLDGDGDMDILTSNYGDKSVSWFENLDGKGNFSPPVFLDPDVPQPAGAIANDLDGDGDPDIIYASWERDEIFWKKNLGSGIFGNPQIIDDYASGVWKLYSSDIDGDGDADLIIPLREGHGLVWYENMDGSGNFSEKKWIDSNMQNAREAYPADVDGDSFIDILTLDWSAGTAIWYRNEDGKGNFSDRKIITEQLTYPEKLICFDLDGNGYPDILTGSYPDLLLIKNTGNLGLFEDPLKVSESDDIGDFYVTDFNNDTHPDILVTHSYLNKLGWFQNDGQGGFYDLHEIAGNFEGYTKVNGADFDRDGDMDLLGSISFTSSLTIHFNLDGAGTTGTEEIVTRPEISGPSDLFLHDSNGNGQQDIFVAAKSDNAVFVYEQAQRNAGFGTAKKIAEIITPSSIFLKDLDGDDIADLLACSEESGQVIWWKNNGQNSFGPAVQIVNFGPGTSCVYSADLDDDGDQDVLVANQWSDKVVWFENNGNAGFSTEKPVGEGLNGATDIFVEDLFGDGLPDILVASKYSRVSYFQNIGNKTFSPEIVIENMMNGVEKVWALDMDGDGDNDILTHNYDKLIWYERANSSGVRSMRHVINENDYLYNIGFVFPADVNGDGLMDVFTSWGQSGNISWFQQEPETKQFSKQGIAPHIINGPVVLNATDVDGDGQNDLISASYLDNKIAWFKNEMVPEFSAQPNDAAICQSGQATFMSSMQDASAFKWQMTPDLSRSFVDITEGEYFSGVNTPTLIVNIPDPSFDQAKFRCLARYKGLEFPSTEALLEVDRLIVANAGEDQQICNDYIYVNGNWPQEGSGHWSVIQGGANFIDPTAPFTRVEQLQSGDNKLVWEIVNGLCSSSDQLIITVLDSSRIESHTQAVEAIMGTTATLLVEATGKDLQYEWYKDGIALEDDERIQGAKSAQLTISEISNNDQGYYQCWVNGFCNTVFTAVIPVSVITSTGEPDNSSIKVFPNPVLNQLHINTGQDINQANIFNATGEKLIAVSTKDTIKALDLTGFQTGMYLVGFLSKDQWHYFRILKL
ncbi:MAG TPA: FG-GAP-like repeat-containing protein [Saprospiraceae bacterium]|nr:hypothetical protein [Saprospirales bacterium]HRQ29268.1 FG-GAP-like repeat-containing protein [Saprospiraceae bacterium]